MIDVKIFEEAAKKICDKLPAGLKNAKDDFEGHVKSVLQTMFSKMDLVTHKEFDQQKAVLKTL
jgi:BMFP domain-containing protein YqiC